MCWWKTREMSLAPSKNESMNSAKLNKIILLVSILLIVAALASMSPRIYHAIRAARAPKIEGAWQGTLQAGPMSLRLKFRFGANAGGALRAEMDSVDQGVTALAASSASFDAPTVKVNFNQIGGSFQGDLSADKSQLAGSWTQGGQTFPLKLERAKPEAAPAPETEADYSYASPAELQGHWRGTLAIQAVNLRIVFNIARKADATYTATLDSPDQGAGRVPASSVACDAPKAYLEWNGIAAAFDGELKDGRLDGTFTQGGARIPLVLQRDASK
jgi:hypothetical protein